MMSFTGTKDYIVSDELMMAVNAAIKLQRPLLLKGEPGTGKTRLAEEVAKSMNAPFLEWHVKSTTKAQQGLYEYDAVSRLRDSQLGEAGVSNIKNYIKKGKLWEAFISETRAVLLIDEIDKADLEFPNDLLLELDKMAFHVYETKETVRAIHRPIIIITSNNEKELPPAFLRRCFFHFIQFPDDVTLQKIVNAHFPEINQLVAKEAIRSFNQLRAKETLNKKPSTAELLDWIGLLLMDEIDANALRQHAARSSLPLHHGALIKNESDLNFLKQSSRQFL
jgi:MoxR-like ATPase